MDRSNIDDNFDTMNSKAPRISKQRNEDRSRNYLADHLRGDKSNVRVSNSMKELEDNRTRVSHSSRRQEKPIFDGDFTNDEWMRASAVFSVERFRKYSTQLDKLLKIEDEHRMMDERDTAEKTGRDRQQSVYETDDSWMDVYRNKDFEEYQTSHHRPVTRIDRGHPSRSTDLVSGDISNEQPPSKLSFVERRSDDRDLFSRFRGNGGCIYIVDSVGERGIVSSKTLLDLKAKRLIELSKRNGRKAVPVPPSTSQPRYAELCAAQELDRFVNLKIRRSYLRNMQRAFSFDRATVSTKKQDDKLSGDH